MHHTRSVSAVSYNLRRSHEKICFDKSRYSCAEGNLSIVIEFFSFFKFLRMISFGMLQKAAANLGFAELASYIAIVQDAEKEKLMLMAALHLDTIQDTLTVLQDTTGGKSIQQQQYLDSKIADVEKTILEALQNIMSLKSDIMFDNVDSADNLATVAAISSTSSSSSCV